MGFTSEPRNSELIEFRVNNETSYHMLWFQPARLPRVALFRQKSFFRKASVAAFEASARRAGGILMDGP
jgi:hypothetical protein